MFDDIAAGAQYLIVRGLAEAMRIGIGGGSHGGTVVAYAIANPFASRWVRSTNR